MLLVSIVKGRGVVMTSLGHLDPRFFRLHAKIYSRLDYLNVDDDIVNECLEQFNPACSSMYRARLLSRSTKRCFGEWRNRPRQDT